MGEDEGRREEKRIEELSGFVSIWFYPFYYAMLL